MQMCQNCFFFPGQPPTLFVLSRVSGSCLQQWSRLFCPSMSFYWESFPRAIVVCLIRNFICNNLLLLLFLWLWLWLFIVFALVCSHKALGNLLTPSDCIIQFKKRGGRIEKEDLFHVPRQFYLTIQFQIVAIMASEGWWEASACPSEGKAASFKPEQQWLSLMTAVSQQVLAPPLLFSA